MIDIDNLILSARKSRDKVRETVLTNIKAKKQELQKAKDAKPYTDEVELKMLTKMAKELAEDIDTAKKANRLDRIDEPTAQLEIVNEFLPKMATREEIENIVKTYDGMTDGKIEQKEMGAVIKYVKSKLSNADGKMTSEVVKSFIR